MTEWKDFNNELMDHMRLGNWGHYRNTRFDMAEYLQENGKYHQALSTYLEVAYWEANDPRNLNGDLDPEILEMFPAFSPKTSIYPPGLLYEINDLANTLELGGKAIKEIYLEVGERLHKNVNLPVDPEDGWKELVEEMEKYLQGRRQ